MEIMQIKQDLQIKSLYVCEKGQCRLLPSSFIQVRSESQAAVRGSDARLREAGIPRGGVNLLRTAPFRLPSAAALQLLLFRVTSEPVP